MSIDEIIREVSVISVDSKDIAAKLAAGQKGLMECNQALATLVKGNKKGEEAAKSVVAATNSLKKAIDATLSLSSSCNKCIRELS